jgi:acyl-CoA hydrolase
MNLEFDNSFTVLPKHCNWMYPMIFGGAFMSELDLCAAMAVSRLLHDSECDGSVTHKAGFTFHRPAEAGDIIFMKAKITGLRNRGIEIKVKAYRERRAEAGQDLIADAEFVFVSKKDGQFHDHGLSMPQA